MQASLGYRHEKSIVGSVRFWPLADILERSAKGQMQKLQPGLVERATNDPKGKLHIASAGAST